MIYVRKIKVSSQGNMGSNLKEGYSPTHGQTNGPQRESRLELFGFDSLVNILGLKRYTECFTLWSFTSNQPLL